MIVLFDGSLYGFFSVVFACYYEKISPLDIQLDSAITLGETLTIETNYDHAKRVSSAIQNKISEEAAEYVYLAFLSFEPDRFMALLAYIKLGFKHGQMVDSHLQEACVLRVHKLSGHVKREAHLLRGFCRFAETKQGVFYCEITPTNDVLPILVSHFTQRFISQAWIIHDKTRCQAAIYDGKECIITAAPHDAAVEFAQGEEETQDLWVAFFKALTIDARKNYKLQRQMMPLHFRKNMTEFRKV